MAKASHILRLSGTIEGLTFYHRNGKCFVRKKSALKGNIVRNSPAFSNTRKAASEFAVAAKLSAQFRKSLAGIFDPFLAPGLHTRFTQAFLTVFRNLPGDRGTRDLILRDTAGILAAFPFWEKSPALPYFRIHLAKAQGPAENRRISVSIRGAGLLPASPGATHLRWYLAAVPLSGYARHSTGKPYRPLVKNLPPPAFSLTPWCKPKECKAALDSLGCIAPDDPPGMVTLIVLGLEYAQLVGKRYESLRHHTQAIILGVI